MSRKRLYKHISYIGLILLSFLFVSIFNSKDHSEEISTEESKVKNVESLSAANPSANLEASSSNDSNAKEKLFKVVRVVDGDTIELETGEKVRYIGINTPETVSPKVAPECFGKEASTKNKELVEGQFVRLVKDVSEKDRYGRLLRYVYVGDIFVNDYLVREGFASSSTYPPDVKYQKKFLEAEKDARENKRGLWGSCSKK